MLQFLRLFLFPFSMLYGAVVFFRNKFYDWGIFSSASFEVPVICIGNLAVGGSGKTPTTEYLVRLLADYKVAILSRGYGRTTKGLVIADEKASARTIGDEPMQYHQKFGHVTVAVCEDRIRGIDYLKNSHDVILLDDAYQHRSVKPGFSILLFEFDKILKRQFLLPVGNLREPLSNYDRANAVLITKSPNPVNIVDQIEIRRKIDTTLDQRISFSSISYGDPIHLFDRSVLPVANLTRYTVFVLTGIANPVPLYRYLENAAARIERFEYPDHHDYSRKDLRKLVDAFRANPSDKKIIITTEKDSQRLLEDNLQDLLLNLPIYYLPIEIVLAPKDKLTFDQNILNYVAGAKRIG